MNVARGDKGQDSACEKACGRWHERHTYLGDSFVPAANHLAFANLELEWTATVAGRIKLTAISQGACGEHNNHTYLVSWTCTIK